MHPRYVWQCYGFSITVILIGNMLIVCIFHYVGRLRVGCRPLIGVDGTFLKSKAHGVLLTAVGRDADDGLYPIAFGLVDKENGEH